METTQSVVSPPPSKEKLLTRYFFPLKNPESPGCGTYLISMVASDSDSARILHKYDEKNRDYGNLLRKWKLSEEELQSLPQSTQVDKWLEEDLDKILERSLTKLGLSREDLLAQENLSELLPTKSQNPMMIYGPLLTKSTIIPAHENVFVIRDNRIRFSCYEVMVVALTQSRIATYTCHFNFMRNAIVQESAKEFLYRDVVSVSTEELMDNYKFETGQSLSIRRQFKLAVASGDNILVSVASPEIQEKLGAEPLLSNHDESVRAIREMLRTKKDSPSTAQVDASSFAPKMEREDNDPVIKLGTLKKMLDAKLISKKEFEDKKKEILSGL
jgi:hypothetical protein